MFNGFLKVCPLPLDPDSIVKQPVGEPDIRCALRDGTEIFFELTEVLDPKVARNHDAVGQANSRMYELVAELPEPDRVQFDKMHAGTTFHIVFESEASAPARDAASQALLNHLCSLPVADGELVVLPKARRFRAIRHVEANRYNTRGVSFTISGGGAFGIPAVDAVRAKFQLRFDAAHRVELLVYTFRAASIAYDTWVPKLIDFVGRELRNSCFQRVWVYDHRHPKLLSVYP